MTPSARNPPLSNLAEEHRLIVRVLAALERYATRLEEAQGVQSGDLGQFAKFFTEFAELLHHVKEEDILIPALVRHGFDWDSGPLLHVREDHAQERYLVDVLRQAASQQGEISREDKRHLVASVRAFVEFQRKHVQNEDSLLFPAVIERLSQDDLDQLDAKFADFDRVKFGQSGYATLMQLGEDLATRYPPALAG
jgi:hemerythrin-like domain-containing protein